MSGSASDEGAMRDERQDDGQTEKREPHPDPDPIPVNKLASLEDHRRRSYPQSISRPNQSIDRTKEARADERC